MSIKHILAVVVVAAIAAPAAAQNPGSDTPVYKPPMRGAPGGRVAGGARAPGENAALPEIDLLAPADHTGLTASASPVLYFFLSQPTGQKLELTVASPSQPRPIVEIALSAPRAAGIQSVRLADLGVQLTPGTLYMWSVSLASPGADRSHDIVASADIMRRPPDPGVLAAAGAAPLRRAAVFAQSGFWYDAVAAAEGESLDGHAALDALMGAVGLAEAVAFDRKAARG